MKPRFKILLSSLLAIFIVLGFALSINPPTGNWYQQFMPNIGGRQITDIFFLDSLTGWAVTNGINQNPDTIFVLKTTNSGDNWVIQNRRVKSGGGVYGYSRIIFLNQNTGYVCGVYTGAPGIAKSIDGGNNWTTLNEPSLAENYLDMSILHIDTLWLVTPDPFAGGVFYTSTGGTSWLQQPAPPSNKIYMYNSNIGFISKGTGTLGIYKTTNGGLNWNLNLPNESFTDMHFTDSLSGWKCMVGLSNGEADSCVKKTTNGGLSWFKQRLPAGGLITVSSQIVRFGFVNKDTIWGAGGQLFYGGGRYRGILYRTTNGGDNWLFQVPDTSFGILGFGYIQLINKNIAWAYDGFRSGIHTTNGGDTTFLTGLKQIGNQIPKEYELYQNYPNPFNPITNIKYQIVKNKFVKLVVYDITGKEIITLVNEEQRAGAYQVDFTGSDYSSGVYFYSLYIDDKLIDTKKMLLIK